MAKEINWNTVLVVLVIGVVGILLLNNSGILTGNMTGSIDSKDKQTILTMLSKDTIYSFTPDIMPTNCNTFCPTQSRICTGVQILDAPNKDVIGWAGCGSYLPGAYKAQCRCASKTA